VITSCEAFENYPPGLPGKNLRITAMIPGGLFLAMQTLRVRALRRTPISLGWMSKRPIPDDVLDRWFKPAQTQRGVRRDLRRYAAGARRHQMLAVSDRLGSFERPTLVVWTPEDRVQVPEHGRRLADVLPNAQLVEIADSYTLIPEDQPHELARAIRRFIAQQDVVSPDASRAGEEAMMPSAQAPPAGA
jgi:pimeloyl-ACP methyl ester carboxylesterase